MKIVSLLLCIILAVTGCAANMSAQENISRDYVKVIPAYEGEDVELQLNELGKHYYCEVLYHSTHRNNKVCYVEKSALEKSVYISKDTKRKFNSALAWVAAAVIIVGSAVICHNSDSCS